MISLRRSNEQDAHLILEWENSPLFREDLFYNGPYELSDILDLITELNQAESAQIRYMICLQDKVIGMVDLCEISNSEAFVSILIADQEETGKGHAMRALEKIEEQAMLLGIRLLKAWIREENYRSIRLFDRMNYSRSITHSPLQVDGVDYIHIQLWTKWLKD
jgi:RimJ/RimL family protein N-acetyltransferase